ncbi:hypothetical protein WR25_24363 isoform A [Diploscapter pachys]|uniref:Symplekin C-terminal domain-containing protein n=1 Tax=Diploscapter pachys TaxID=2018661 RepID=A0A2A2LSC0_9BILA|nr:hypothetical protein WR25_24363 isoform A [Diploscapter pachys]
MDKFVEPIEDTATVAERVSKAIKEAHEAANVDDKLKLLEDAADILINNDQSAHLLDSFCEEMLEFVDNPQFTIKCFVVSFIQRACLRDPEVTKKAITTLSALLSIDRQYPGASRIIRRVIIACTNIYPSIIQWAVRKKTDLEAGACWEAFSILKGRILQLIDNDNEGIRTVTLKFLETIVLAQSPRPVKDDAVSGMEMISLEEKSRHELVSLTDVPRDHRFISYRKLQIEADENFKSLLNQFTLMHLSAQNLLVLINVVCNIAKLRSGWEKTLERIMDALEVLHVNLPPTLGTSQVKSVRKELKFHLFRLLKMPAAVVIQQKLITLLTDLGASASEVNRNLPPNSAMLPKRGRRGEAAEETAKRARVEAKIEDDEYPDESAAGPSTSSASSEPSQLTAIDVTAQWIYERLNPQLVTNLVLISLVTFPEEMPAMFASSYTPIAAAGTENQKKHLARMMATQATQAEIGPGFEQMKAEKLKRMQDRIEARKQGAVIAPTPYVNRDTQPEPSGSKKSEAKLPLPTFTAPKPKQQFNLISSVQKMTKKEMSEVFDHLYHRIMGAERRAIQGGAIQQQNLLLVIRASRFQSNDEHFEDLLINYIIEEHKQRTELALLYLTEIYAQYQGFSHIHIPLKQLRDHGMSKSQLYERYDRILCKMLKNLTVRDLHRETIFHKLLLESPTVTPNSVVYLKEFSALGLTTLRELILTRNRQRLELIDLLFSLGFHDKPDKLRQSVVDIVKELWELSYLREDIRNKLREQIECCTLDVPPRHFQTLLEAPNKWTENIYRNALHLYLALLQIDTTLLMPLAVAYAKGPIEFKRIVLRLVEPVVKTIGVQNQEMLDLVAECPLGAETLILRFVHLITERNPPTRELVDRVRSLHATRNTDARGMIPILSGLDREDIVNLLPHFVLNSSNQKFVQVVIKRLLTGKNPDTLEPTITGEDLIFEYHKLEPREEEERKMHVENLSELLDSRHIQKDHIAAAIEKILELDVVPPLFYHTLTVVDKKFPSLDSFISNVVQKVILRELWKANDETRKAFFRSIIQLRSVAYAPMLTEFRGDEFLEFVEYAGNQIILDLRDFYPTLSTSQRRSVATEISDKVRDKDAEEKQRLKAGKDGKGSKENKEKEKDKDKEREDDRENQEQEREAMRESRRNKEQQKEKKRIA